MERIVTATLMLLIAGLAQLSTAHPSYYPSNGDGEMERYAESENQPSRFSSPGYNELAYISYKPTKMYALTVFMTDPNKLKVYSNGGPNGKLLATLDISDTSNEQDGIVKDSKNLIAYQRSYIEPGGATLGSVYYFNMRALLEESDGFTIHRSDACSFFDSETDYPYIDTRRSTGADGLGNHGGLRVFGNNQYTFWVVYNKPHHVLKHSTAYDWEGQIVCVSTR